MKKLLIIAAGLLAVACTGSGDGGRAAAASENAAQTEPAHVAVSRLDVALARGEMPDSSASAAVLALLEMSRLGNSLNAQAIGDYAATPAVRMFEPEVLKVFPAGDTLKAVSDALGRMTALIPSLKAPHVYTVVSPYKQSVVMLGDTTMLLALNHYLGATHPAYRGFADYLTRLKTPGRTAIDAAEAFAAISFPYSAKNPTTLSRLLYEGAVVEAVMQASGADEATMLGYTPDQMKWAEENEAQAWDALLTRKMLFSTDPMIAERLTQPSPATTLLNAGSPGRLGRFIGHRIVAAYLEANPSTTLQQLLSPDFYDNSQTLKLSGYPK